MDPGRGAETAGLVPAVGGRAGGGDVVGDGSGVVPDHGGLVRGLVEDHHVGLEIVLRVRRGGIVPGSLPPRTEGSHRASAAAGRLVNWEPSPRNAVALTVPFTSNGYAGLVVFTPTRLVEGWIVRGEVCAWSAPKNTEPSEKMAIRRRFRSWC